MQKLEILRSRLHIAIENGCKKEIQNISESLDREILKYMSEYAKNKKTANTYSDNSLHIIDKISIK